MTTAPTHGATATPITPEAAAEARTALMKDIRTKWSKFTDIDMAGLSSREALVILLVAKYNFDKVAAGRDADMVLKGRTL